MRTNDTQMQANRLRAAREALYERIEDGWRAAKKHTDISESAYTHHENGTRGFKARAEAYARAFNTTAAWLLFGDRPNEHHGIPIVGKAAAGPDGHFINAYPLGGAPTLDPWPEDDAIAVDVEGDSMIPRFRPREKLVFGARHYDPTPLIGQEVLAELTDGRTLIKVLRRSAEPGKWDLYSINTSYTVIEAVEILWVRPFEGLRV